jgi:hypothetical protein
MNAFTYFFNSNACPITIICVFQVSKYIYKENNQHEIKISSLNNKQLELIGQENLPKSY